MRRLRITVCYDGSEFHGWQVQPQLTTIQGTLQAVLGEIEGAAVAVTGSGRTDAGVHALAQVASFDLRNPIPCDNLRRAMNRLLPHSVRVVDAVETSPTFHARKSAIAKTYEYRIVRSEICPPFERRYVHHHPYPLDPAAMAQMALLFEGTHNFRVFAASDERYTPDYDTTRTIYSSRLTASGERLIYRVRGNGFLKHMVRNLAGTLLQAGRGNFSPSEWPPKSGQTAPPGGLFLISVEYPDSYASS